MSDVIQYIQTETPSKGTYIAIAEGVYWLRMPLPISLGHINLWLIEGKDSFSIVDTG